MIEMSLHISYAVTRSSEFNVLFIFKRFISDGSLKYFLSKMAFRCLNQSREKYSTKENTIW